MGHSKGSPEREVQKVHLHMNLVLGGGKIRSPHPPTTILDIYVEALNGLGYVYHEDGLNNTVLHHPWLLLWKPWAEHTLQEQGSRGKGEGLLNRACRSTGGHILSMTSSSKLNPK